MNYIPVDVFELVLDFSESRNVEWFRTTLDNYSRDMLDFARMSFLSTFQISVIPISSRIELMTITVLHGLELDPVEMSNLIVFLRSLETV